MKNTRYRSIKSSLIAICGAVTWAGISLVHAQPDGNNPSVAVNPANQTVGMPKMRAESARQNFQWRLEMMGINQVTAQEAIIAYVENESAQRDQIIKKGKELGIAVLGVNNSAQVTAQLETYREMAEQNKARQAKARAALEESVHISRYPRVEATLILMGVYGESPAIFGGIEEFARGKEAPTGVAAALKNDRTKASLKGRAGINMNRYGK